MDSKGSVDTKSRRITTKGVLEKVTGKRLKNNLLSAKDKVEIMEYLLQCQTAEMIGYNDNTYPTFIVECALLLIDNKFSEYMAILDKCRQMAREDGLT